MGEKEKEIGKGGDRKNSSEIFVVSHSFKSLIKENNFAVWRNEEGGRRERGGNGRALFFLTLSAGTVLGHKNCSSFTRKYTVICFSGPLFSQI